MISHKALLHSDSSVPIITMLPACAAITTSATVRSWTYHVCIIALYRRPCAISCSSIRARYKRHRNDGSRILYLPTAIAKVGIVFNVSVCLCVNKSVLKTGLVMCKLSRRIKSASCTSNCVSYSIHRNLQTVGLHRPR